VDSSCWNFFRDEGEQSDASRIGYPGVLFLLLSVLGSNPQQIPAGGGMSPVFTSIAA
jgi:hypothetical protein